MGSILVGACQNCHYSTGRMMEGGGFKYAGEDHGFPVFDKENSEVRMENILDRENLSKNHPEIVFYDDASLTQNPNPQKGQYNRDGNLCPRCHQFTLSFNSVGSWD